MDRNVLVVTLALLLGCRGGSDARPSIEVGSTGETARTTSGEQSVRRADAVQQPSSSTVPSDPAPAIALTANAPAPESCVCPPQREARAARRAPARAAAYRTTSAHVPVPATPQASEPLVSYAAPSSSAEAVMCAAPAMRAPIGLSSSRANDYAPTATPPAQREPRSPLSGGDSYR